MSVTFSSNLSNFENNQKIQEKKKEKKKKKGINWKTEEQKHKKIWKNRGEEAKFCF